MAKKIDKQIIQAIKEFVETISKYYKIEQVFLFGSFAKGCPHDDSDIDVAIVSSDIKDEWNDGLRMMDLRLDLRIEPHPINTVDFINNETSLVNEIKTFGIEIKVA